VGDYRLSACDRLLDMMQGDDLRAAVLTYRALARHVLGDLDAAFADTNSAIEVDPLYADAYLHRGLVQEARGNLDQAAADLRIAVRLGAETAELALRRVQIAQAARLRNREGAEAVAGGSAPRRMALVIGNGKREDDPVVRDAQAMAALFRDLAFESVALHVNLDPAGMAEALAAFEREASAADWAVVYLSGYADLVDGEVRITAFARAVGERA
jgi:tetratricopeptide (TPR) repeat protein